MLIFYVGTKRSPQGMGFKEWLKLKKTMALFGLLALVLLALVALVVVYVVNPIGESFEHVQNLFIFFK